MESSLALVFHTKITNAVDMMSSLQSKNELYGNEYWWKKSKRTPNYGLKKAEGTFIFMTYSKSSVDEQRTFYASKSIEYNIITNKVELVSSVEKTASWYDWDSKALTGWYVTGGSYAYNDFEDVIFYIGNDTTLDCTNKYYNAIINPYVVTITFTESVSYVHSTSSTAYPINSVAADGYLYEYIGCPQSNMSDLRLQIYEDYYIGEIAATSDATSTNRTFTFPITPKLVKIVHLDAQTYFEYNNSKYFGWHWTTSNGSDQGKPATFEGNTMTLTDSSLNMGGHNYYIFVLGY